MGSNEEVVDLSDGPVDVTTDLSAYFTTVTPVRAEAWLASMVTNRRIGGHTLTALIRDIRAGQWHMTGDPIKFNTDGHLIDGQHRLRAIIQTGRALDLLVVTGLSPAAMTALDGGRRRSPADHLVVANLCAAGDSTLMAAGIRHWVRFCGSPVMGTTGVVVPPWALVAIGRTRCTTLQPWIPVIKRQAFRRVRLGSMGEHLALAYITELVDWEAAKLFWDRLTTGTQLSADDPEYVLREKFATFRAREVRHIRGTYTAMTIKAWNARRTGKGRISMRKDEKFPAIAGWPWPDIDLVAQTKARLHEKREAGEAAK